MGDEVDRGQAARHGLPVKVPDAPPSVGQLLTATGPTTAEFQDPPASGGSQPVSVAAKIGSGLDLHLSGAHPLKWAELCDNAYDLNTISELPDGLGLSFAFDGSSATITTTEAGTWSFTVGAYLLQPDETWGGYLLSAWSGTFQQPLVAPGDQTPLGVLASVFELPAGAVGDFLIVVSPDATTDPYPLARAIMAITRLA